MDNPYMEKEGESDIPGQCSATPGTQKMLTDVRE